MFQLLILLWLFFGAMLFKGSTEVHFPGRLLVEKVIEITSSWVDGCFDAGEVIFKTTVLATFDQGLIEGDQRLLFVFGEFVGGRFSGGIGESFFDSLIVKSGDFWGLNCVRGHRPTQEAEARDKSDAPLQSVLR